MRQTKAIRKVKLLYVQVVGQYVYLRPPGAARAKLPALDDPGFLDAYTAAMRAAQPKPVQPKAAKDSVAAMIDAFLVDDEFTSKSAGYQRTLRRHCIEIRRQAEDMGAAELAIDDIQDDLDALPPFESLERAKTWRLLCKFGRRRKFFRVDPSNGISRMPLPKSDGRIPWSLDDIDLYRARWPIDTPQRLAMELIYWTAARTIDAVEIGPRLIDRDGVLGYQQHKTNFPAFVPWTCELPDYAKHCAKDREILFACLATAKVRRMTYLATAYGEPRSEKALSGFVAEAARDAKLVDRTAHGLRKSRCIALADGGCTQQQGMSWSGHMTEKEWSFYCRMRDRRRAVRGTSTTAAL